MRYYIFLVSIIALSACSDSGNTEQDMPLQANAGRIVAAAQTCGNAAPTTNLTPSCVTPVSDGFEPPCNPHLAQGEWSSTHRGNFSQSSSFLPGVTTPDRVNIDRLAMANVPVALNFSDPDSANRQAIWASTLGPGITGGVIKVDADKLTLIDRIPSDDFFSLSASGVYTILDRDQNFIVGKSSAIKIFGDLTPNDRHSAIQLKNEFRLPKEALCGDRNDVIVGMTMLQDGHLAFATKFGVVGVMPRQPEGMCSETLKLWSINGEKCADTSVPDDQLEDISNSISADEKGGIYVTTSFAQYRLNWDGVELKSGWRAAYSGGGGAIGAGRLGAGSGSTPTLMGKPGSQDRFVVISDGQELAHLVLMWMDDIPSDWQPIKPGLDRRIACEVPINFGDSSVTQSLSEQSVVVRGFSSIVVNNQIRLNSLLSLLPANAQPLVAFVSGIGFNKPKGLQRIDWDPVNRRCETKWANTEISLPNGIPSMSAGSNQIFGVGSRSVLGVDFWTLEALDFDTGKSRFSIFSTPYPTDNSVYAPAIIGPNNSILTGTFGGITRFSDCADEVSCGRRTLNPLLHIPLPSALVTIDP